MTVEEKRAYCIKHGYSLAYSEYWEHHPACEVCCADWSQPPHHIKTRGAGGDDVPENLLALCQEHHGMIHAMGDLMMARMVGGDVQKKIMAVKKGGLTNTP